MEIRVEKTENSTVLAVSGELNVETASALRTSLEQTLASRSAALLQLDAVGRTDVAGLQLIVSAMRTFADAGVPFSLNAGAAVRRIASEAGFELPDDAAPATARG